MKIVSIGDLQKNISLITKRKNIAVAIVYPINKTL